MPVYFEVLDKRSAIAVGPTANVLNVIDAEADRGALPRPCRGSCFMCTPAGCALPRRTKQPRLSRSRLFRDSCLLHLAPEGFSAKVISPPPLPRQLLRVHADGLRLASEI